MKNADDKQDILENKFWIIEKRQSDPEGAPYYRYPLPGSQNETIPLFLSKKDAEIFFDQKFIHPKKWEIHELTISYMLTYFLLSNKSSFNATLFYSWDPKNKGWGVKNIEIDMREDYFKM